MTPYTDALAITPSDTVDLPSFQTHQRVADGLYVGGAGNVVAVLADGATVTLTAVAGEFIPLGVRRVNATNTTATALVAFYRN